MAKNWSIWHINNGDDKLASFYPLERFRKKLYRPDVIALLPEKRNVAEALGVANEFLPKPSLANWRTRTLRNCCRRL